MLLVHDTKSPAKNCIAPIFVREWEMANCEKCEQFNVLSHISKYVLVNGLLSSIFILCYMY